MRSAARLGLNLLLWLVVFGAALSTLRSLREVDPRGRASWGAAAIAFDATPRDATLFLPACDIDAVVLHPSGAADGRIDAEFFVAAPDGSAQRVGTTSVVAVTGAPIAIPLGNVTPPWRAPLVVRLRDAGGILSLDARRPMTLVPRFATRLGSLGCALDGGATTPGLLLVLTVMWMSAFTIMIAGVWLARALGVAQPALGVRGATALAVMAAGATLVAYTLVVPPFEPPDELAHLQYARFVATTGSLPSEVPAHDSEWRASSYEFVQQPLYYLGAAALLKATGLEAPGPAVTLNPRSRLHAGGTEPSIFWHAGPPQPATGHRALRVLRLASLLMALATTWIIARLLTTVTSDPLVVATVAGGLGLIPQWCAVMGAVSTDPPATLLAAAATLAIARVTRGRGTTGLLLLTGLLIGAAYAVKATAVFLAPMAILACLLAARRAGQERTGASTGGEPVAILAAALRPVLLVGAGIVLAAAWLHVRAWMVFGDPSAHAFKRAVLEAGGFVPTAGPMPWTPEFWAQMRVMVFEPFWARFGSLGAGPFPGSKVWLPYAAASVLLVALATWSTLAAAASLWRARHRDPAAPDTSGVMLVCALGVVLGLAAWGLVNLVPRADMVVHWTPRHILPLTAPAAVLVGAGLERLRTTTGVVQRLGAAATGLTVVVLALAWLGVLRATVLMFHFGY
ncbi:hypothetical protein [Luteitalea sp.]|uniref:hypothetical protein n=1 Tax=Luteitalea sp. TaxID=2004800 RepID=UPI000B2F6D4E|nr:hypothetical protein [Luteitalea sp.]